MVDAITQALLRRIAESIRILNTNMSFYMKEMLVELRTMKKEIADLKGKK